MINAVMITGVPWPCITWGRDHFPRLPRHERNVPLYSHFHPRNMVVADVFHRLYTEKFWHRHDPYFITRFPSQPEFEITSDLIRVVLPVIDYDSEPQEPSLNESILLFLSEKGALSRAEIEEHTGFKRTKVLDELGQMLSDGKIEVIGSGPYTKYRIK